MKSSILILAMLVAPLARPVFAQSNDSLAVQVRATETAFAATMAARDSNAFATFLDDETVFFGRRGPMRGKATVAAAWGRFFAGGKAPFSWKPEDVAVLGSGTLGLTSGPVFDSDGKRTGTFNSVWRRGADGRWKIVFDKGCPACDCPEK